MHTNMQEKQCHDLKAMMCTLNKKVDEEKKHQVRKCINVQSLYIIYLFYMRRQRVQKHLR